MKPLNTDIDDWYGSPQLHDPRNIARALLLLDRVISRAATPNARATALYAKATFIYHYRDLLFYNAALWQGGRSEDFSFFWNSRVATRRDRTAVRRHHFEHECLYRVREICLQIVRQYPRSPTAPKALYRAACATNYLTEFDGWWRDEADRQDFADEAVRLMQRVYQQYPRDILAGAARKFAGAFAAAHAAAARNLLFQVAEQARE